MLKTTLTQSPPLWTRVLPLLLLLTASLATSPGQPASPVKARVLIVTGIDYPGHLWRETAPALASVLKADPRLDIRVVEDPWFLDSSALTNYQAVIIHFQNWQTNGPGESARQNLKRFVERGGGLMCLHFGCGAWVGEWPEFVEILGRVYDPKARPHDPYGSFHVEIVGGDHPVTRGLAPFETTDELYTCLVGDRPIHVLGRAVSKVDQKDYPMAFSHEFGKGRVFLTTLGHNVSAITNSTVPDLMRRGCAWVAGLPLVP